jgi:hypothetical protein
MSYRFLLGAKSKPSHLEERLTMMNGIQCLAPSRRPTADEMGWKRTNVMKNNETARFKSSGAAPMSVVKPAWHECVVLTQR